MKRFSFPLSRVLQLRRLQQDRAQAELLRLQQEQTHLRQQQADLRQEKTASLEAQRTAGTLTGSDLQMLSSYQRRLAAVLVDLEQQSVKKADQISAQQAVANDLERSCRLLERMREREHAEWKQLEDKELDEISADAYLSRMRTLKENSRT